MADSLESEKIPLPIATLRYASGTDVGLRREENQDSLGVIEQSEYRLYIVADGMGGVKGGAIASSLAISTIRDRLAQTASLTPDILVEAVRLANDAIYQRGCSEEGMHGMGTTIVGLGFVGESLVLLNVGDSRAYRIRGENATQLTDDHTLVRELVRSGAITEDQAKNHPVSHMLTRSLGPTLELAIDCAYSITPPARGDRFLLCSDGLYNLVTPEEMAMAVNELSSLDEAVQHLIALANERGGTDNITVIIIEVGEGYPEPAAEHPLLSSPGASFSSPSEPPPITLTEGQENAVPSHAAMGDAQSEGASEDSATTRDSLTPPEQVPVEKFNRLQMLLLGIFGIGIFVGALSGYVFKKPEVSDASVQTSPHPVAGQVAPVRPVIDPKSAHNVPLQVPHLALRDPASDVSARTADKMISQAEIPRDGIQTRKMEIERKLTRISTQLAALDRPLDGAFVEMLDQSKERDASQARLESLLRDLEVETRRLSIWVGRRTRLGTIDPVDLASEIAAVSPAVKAGKEAFEKASWDYLREVEVFRYNPHDEKLQERISDLARVRSQRIEDLSQAVVTAVTSEIESSNQRLAEISAARDQLEQELAELEKDSDFTRLLGSGDANAKALKKQELVRERELLTAELRDLR